MNPNTYISFAKLFVKIPILGYLGISWVKSDLVKLRNVSLVESHYLTSESEGIREIGVDIIRKIGGQDAAQALINVVMARYLSGNHQTRHGDEEPGDVYEAVRELGSVGDERAIVPLAEFVKSGFPGSRKTSWQCRREAVASLEKLSQKLAPSGKEEIIKSLLSCLAKPLNVEVGERAMDTLGNLTRQPFGKDRSRWLEWAAERDPINN